MPTQCSVSGIAYQSLYKTILLSDIKCIQYGCCVGMCAIYSQGKECVKNVILLRKQIVYVSLSWL